MPVRSSLWTFSPSFLPLWFSKLQPLAWQGMDINGKGSITASLTTVLSLSVLNSTWFKTDFLQHILSSCFIAKNTHIQVQFQTLTSVPFPRGQIASKLQRQKLPFVALQTFREALLMSAHTAMAQWKGHGRASK